MQPIANFLDQALSQIENALSGNLNIVSDFIPNKINELIQRIPSLTTEEQDKLKNYALKLYERGEKESYDRITKAFENKGQAASHVPAQQNQVANNLKLERFQILDATEEIVKGKIISPLSIQLDLCSDSTFTGYVKSSKLIKAKVEARYIDLDYLLLKMKTMTKNEARSYFKNHFEMFTRLGNDNVFTIIIKPLNEEKITSVEVLVELLNLTEKNTASYGILQNLAENVFNSGKEKSIQYVEPLACANNEFITKKLLQHLIELLNRNGLFTIDHLKTLKITLINSSQETLTELLKFHELTCLLNVVKIQIEKVGKGDVATTYMALSTFSEILDLMVDANIIKIEEEKIIKPLSDMLNQYSKHVDVLICSQANYALQALERIPKTSSARRRVEASLKGFTGLCKMVANKDLSHLVEVYKNFKEAFESGKDREDWYHEMRFLKLLVFTNNQEEFKKKIKSELKNTRNDLVAGNVFAILCDQCHHVKLEWRKVAFNLLGELFLDDKRWGSNKELKKAILGKLQDCALGKDQDTARQAILVLNGFSANLHIPSFQKTLLDKIQIPSLPQGSPAQVYPSPVDLLGEARKRSYINLEQRIWQMRERFYDQRAQDPLDQIVYIQTDASISTFDPSNNPFDLHSKKITPFLRGKDPVFLLLGDSGSGKSQYLNFLHEWLWQDWDDHEPIPILINLNAIKMPFEEAIKKILKSYGFSDEECSI